MNNQKLILSILGLLVLFGVGYMIVSSNKEEVKTPIDEGIEQIDEEKEIVKINPVDGVQNLNTNVALMLSDKVTFSDGLEVTLKEINDSRCDPKVVCIWQGEISSLIDVSGGKIKTPAELVLGTEKFKTQSINGYTFTLISATEKSITIKVIYEKGPTNSGGCWIGGCSGQICSDQQDVMSNCEYREEYACYKTATCERQSTGQCGWTPTVELNACLSAN